MSKFQAVFEILRQTYPKMGHFYPWKRGSTKSLDPGQRRRQALESEGDELPAGGLGGAVSPPTGSRGGAPGSYWFLEHLEVFEEVLEEQMSEFFKSNM